MELLVFNYSMNRNSQVFSHQRTVVQQLSKHFSHIDVITAEAFQDSPIDGVSVYSTNWIAGRKIRNIVNFYRIAIPLLLKHKRGKLFSHMTEVQTSLSLPISKLLGIKHFLWYAHKSPSRFLSFSYPLVDGVVTSTPGSCPISSNKVFPIGQAVDTKLSSKISELPGIPPRNWYHVGRIDPSKNIDLIIEALQSFQKENNEITLDFYGAPSSKKTNEYFAALKQRFSTPEYSSWVVFHGSISRERLSEISLKHDAFIHAFWGSLDKALVEAILLKRIVVSSNPEYLKEFCNRVIQEKEISQELNRQLGEIYSFSSDRLMDDIQRKNAVAQREHSLEEWISRLTTILRSK